MLINPVRKSLFAFLLCLPSLVQALPEDAHQAIHITADSATRNDKTGITIYSGDVILTQGSMKITGKSLELRQTKKAVTSIIAKGSLAQFQQRPAADKEITHAYGKVLDYNIRTKELEITGQAKVSQGTDSFSGNRIIYDMKKSTVNAFGDNSSKGERVQMIIQPKVTPSPEAETATKPSAGESNSQ
jgi:lipopolysaccharide export system protein LptA